MSDLVVLVGNPRPGSRTRTAAVHVAELIDSSLGCGEPDVIDLAEHVAIGFTDETVRPVVPALDALERVQSATVLVVASPSYKGTFTGLLKVFLDQLGHHALAGVIAVPVAVAGSPAHVASTSNALARLMVDLGAQVAGPIGLMDSQLDPSVVAGQVRAVLPTVTAAVPS